MRDKVGQQNRRCDIGLTDSDYNAAVVLPTAGLRNVHIDLLLSLLYNFNY